MRASALVHLCSFCACATSRSALERPLAVRFCGLSPCAGASSRSTCVRPLVLRLCVLSPGVVLFFASVRLHMFILREHVTQGQRPRARLRTGEALQSTTNGILPDPTRA